MSDDATYVDEEPVTIGFAVALSGVRVAAWSLLWAATVALGVYRRRSRTKGWTLYKIILAAVSLLCIRFIVYLHYADSFNRGHDVYAMKVFNVYIFFANLSSSFFLVGRDSRLGSTARAPARRGGAPEHPCAAPGRPAGPPAPPPRAGGPNPAPISPPRPPRPHALPARSPAPAGAAPPASVGLLVSRRSRSRSRRSRSRSRRSRSRRSRRGTRAAPPAGRPAGRRSRRPCPPLQHHAPQARPAHGARAVDPRHRVRDRHGERPPAWASRPEWPGPAPPAPPVPRARASPVAHPAAPLAALPEPALNPCSTPPIPRHCCCCARADHGLHLLQHRQLHQRAAGGDERL
jgi:hypothetical protein